MYKLHYAELNLQGDIPCININTKLGLENKIINIFLYGKDTYGEPDRVYLLSFYDKKNKKDLIFVSEYPDFILDIIRNTHFSFDITYVDDFFLQEYSSYEAAYEVALSMKEISPLCYEPDNNLN